jgi:hypothetical protein
MDADDRQTDDSKKRPAEGAWFIRRKRIVAHEVKKQHTAEIEAEMRSAGENAIVPSELMDAPPVVPRTIEPLVDLSVFTGRQRKRAANLAYRFTQFAIAVGVFAAAVAIFCALQEDPMTARILSGAACLLGAISVRIVRRSRLAHRLRGYSGALCVLAVLAAITSWVPIHFHSEMQNAASETHTSNAAHP